MIEVKNLTKKYGNHFAVNDISFTIEKGQICGFLGANGAGKSTTMNILAGYLAPTAGEVKMNGYLLGQDNFALKKCIGYLPENPPLYHDMLVKEYLDFVACLKKIPKADKNSELETVMKQVGISNVSDRLIGNLSKGYQQRIGIAQALLGKPEIIILDEPTVGLDPKQMKEIRMLIKGLKGKHTVIFSSHILSEISAVCDSVLVIDKGKILTTDAMDKAKKSKISLEDVYLELINENTAGEEE